MCDITATLWFLLLTAAGGALAQGEVYFFNDEMDGLLSQIREDIRHANTSRFPLPDVQVMYNRKILFLNIRDELNGTSGTVWDMSTIRRTSNATIVTSKGYFVFRAEFGFDLLKVGYKYNAKVLGVPLGGDLELTVEDNSIYVELLVNLTENRCSGEVATIKNLRLTTLDRISAKVTGFSIANRLMSHLLTRSLTDISTKITTPIEDGLRSFFHGNIKHFDFCKFGTVPENVPFDDRDSSADLTDELTINDKSKGMNAVLN